MSPSTRRTAIRWRVEAVLAAVSGVLCVVTFFWHDWIEAFGFDPDHGDGSVEWLIVAALAVVSVALAILARTEWRRAATAR